MARTDEELLATLRWHHVGATTPPDDPQRWRKLMAVQPSSPVPRTELQRRGLVHRSRAGLTPKGMRLLGV